MEEIKTAALEILKKWFSYAFEHSSAENMNNIWLLIDYVHNDLKYVHKPEYMSKARDFMDKLEASGRAQDEVKTVKNAIFLFDKKSE